MDGSFASGCSSSRQPGRRLQVAAERRCATITAASPGAARGTKARLHQHAGDRFQQHHVLSLQKPLAAGTFPGKDIDWENIHLRVKHPAGMIINECDLRRRLEDRLPPAQPTTWKTCGSPTATAARSRASPRATSSRRKSPGRDSSPAKSTSATPRTTSPSCSARPAGLDAQHRDFLRGQDDGAAGEVFLEMFDRAGAPDENFYDDKFHGARLETDPHEVSRPSCRTVPAQGRPLRPHCPDVRRAQRLAPRHHRQPWHAGAADHRSRLAVRSSPSGAGPENRRDRRDPPISGDLNLRAGDRIIAIDGILLAPRIGRHGCSTTGRRSRRSHCHLQQASANAGSRSRGKTAAR